MRICRKHVITNEIEPIYIYRLHRYMICYIKKKKKKIESVKRDSFFYSQEEYLEFEII